MATSLHETNHIEEVQRSIDFVEKATRKKVFLGDPGWSDAAKKAGGAAAQIVHCDENPDAPWHNGRVALVQDLLKTLGVKVARSGIADAAPEEAEAGSLAEMIVRRNKTAPGSWLADGERKKVEDRLVLLCGLRPVHPFAPAPCRLAADRIELALSYLRRAFDAPADPKTKGLDREVAVEFVTWAKEAAVLP